MLWPFVLNWTGLVNRDRRSSGRVSRLRKPPLKIDRRTDPSYGYRAMHVIVYPESTPMEIQIRTKLQDGRAQVSEKLGDAWERGLRYGVGPDLPDSPSMMGSPITRGDFVEQLQLVADAIDRIETNEARVAQLRESSARPKRDDLDGLLGDPDMEVVVLGAISGESLRRTHGRYFKGFDELAADAMR